VRKESDRSDRSIRRIVRKDANLEGSAMYLRLDCGHTVMVNASPLARAALTAYCHQCAILNEVQS